jgi:hypothetical protein
MACSEAHGGSSGDQIAPFVAEAGLAETSRLGISLATARTHLEHIFEKTGVHRQAELLLEV